jgi:undecaprenyl-diphosphatase
MLTDLIKAAILGTVQGLTEFLPVSSTGHLIIVEDLLNVDQETYGLDFDAALHLGTLLALLLYFGRTWVDLFQGGVRAVQDRSLAEPTGRLAWLIVLGTIPAATLGLLFESEIEHAFRSPALVATMLILFSGVFVLAERVGRRTRDIDHVNWIDSVVVGLAQSIALIPGVSRSGATICAGLFRDVKREDAARFAFLLSAPIIAGAASSQMVGVVQDFIDGKFGWDEFAFFITGFVFAAAVGYWAIAFLLKFLATNTLMPFVYYRVALGLMIFAVLGVQQVA